MNDEIIKRVNDRLDQAIDRGRTIISDEDFQEKLEEVKTKSEEVIKKHPIKSVLVGFAVGYVLSKLFSSED